MGNNQNSFCRDVRLVRGVLSAEASAEGDRRGGQVRPLQEDKEENESRTKGAQAGQCTYR